MGTSSISISFSMKRGVWLVLDFLERARLMWYGGANSIKNINSKRMR
jgi:hypothetical protein